MDRAPKLSIILASEELEKVHAASLMGSVAAMSGMEVSLFVTMNALIPFLKKTAEKQSFKMGEMGTSLLEKTDRFDTLLENGKALGALKVYACALAMDVMGWTMEDFLPVFDDVIGVTAFLNMAQDGQILTM